MAVRTKVQLIEVEGLLQDFSPAAQTAVLAAFAQEQLAEGEATNARALGHVPSHTTIVDGRQGADIASVKPNGTVVFEFEMIATAIEWLEQQLVEHSPQRSGRYSRSHVLLADGEEVQFGATVPPVSEYVLINTQPYAAKIERGLSSQASSGVYEAVAVLGARRFGNMAKISFSFRVPPAGAVHEWASSTAMTRKGRPNMKSATRAEWLRRQPAIVVTV